MGLLRPLTEFLGTEVTYAMSHTLKKFKQDMPRFELHYLAQDTVITVLPTSVLRQNKPYH